MNRKVDYKLLLLVISLGLFGLLMVYSASNVVSLDDFNDKYYYVKRQGLFFIISLIVSYFIIKYDVRKLMKYTNIIFIFCLILLFIVLIPGVGVVRGGARSWISIFGFSVQPSEFMKVGLVFLFAKFLSTNYKDLQKFSVFIKLFSVSVLIFLVIMLQPDFGTGIVILISSLCLMFISGTKIKYFSYIGIVGIIGLTCLIITAPYRLERITAFLDPWSDPLGSGFQGIQSLFAITPGGLLGHGFNQSIQKHFFLPEPQNDFIFAIILEEFGLIGGLFVLFVFYLIFSRCFQISIKLSNKFLKFLCCGITLTLLIQVLINTAVVTGLLPVTGITLPLFSYGGSSLLITFVSFSIIISASKYIDEEEI